jgi:hypothetical protein
MGTTAAGSLAAGSLAAGGGLMASIPTWLQAISSGGQLLSGISSRLSAAGQANAEAAMLRAQGRLRAAQEMEKGQEITAKGHAIAAASGIEASSGSPLTMMLANLDTAVRNATRARKMATMEADTRSMEASGYTSVGSMAGAVIPPVTSLLSKWV